MNGRVRLAVGAIVYSYLHNDLKYILIQKEKVMDTKTGNPHTISAYWDFPKGGKKEGEDDFSALKRELKEELGLEKFKIVMKLPFSLEFKFPKKIKEKIGFSSQKTNLFLVNFQGNESEIQIDKEELKEFGIFPFNSAIKKLGKKESKEVFKDAHTLLVSILKSKSI
ncbi:NUDIX domain-containing protein [archaeon]|nr:MAG: NUDIX domain-containing protein [archaeon]